jgi:hypothetical protein
MEAPFVEAKAYSVAAGTKITVGASTLLLTPDPSTSTLPDETV